LSIEKALKAFYYKTTGIEPPKLHNLLYFVKRCHIPLPEDLFDFVYTLNSVSIPTRYPDELRGMLKTYDKTKTKEILSKSKEVLKWARENS
jgi:HEPN domain-containing protein